MASRYIDIRLRAEGAGKVSEEFGKVKGASRDLVANVKKLGMAFGELGGDIGGGEDALDVGEVLYPRMAFVWP